MNKLVYIAQILAEANLGTPGVDLFVHSMPEGKTAGIVVLEDPGTPTEISEDIPKLRKGTATVVVRGSDYQTAYSLAKSVSTELDFHRRTVGGFQFLRLRPMFEPVAYSVPDSDVIEVAVNLWAAYIDS